MRAILALDLAAQTGWAWGPPGGTPLHGSVLLAPSKSELGMRFKALRCFISDFIIKHDSTDVVIFEAPVPQTRGRTTLATLRALYGYPAIVEEMFHESGRECVEATVNEVRRHFIGTGGLPGNVAKPMVIAKCQALGWYPADDNAADALALWHFQASLLDPRMAVEVSPLFRRRATA